MASSCAPCFSFAFCSFGLPGRGGNQSEETGGRGLPQARTSNYSAKSTQRREKEVMLRLKEVVDKQRDEIRAQAHEILCKARDTEALQEQLNRFMTVNEEIRRKLAIVQAQLQSALQRKEELESALLEARQEVERLSEAAGAAKEALRTSATDQEVAPGEELPGSGQGRRSYSKEELQQVLQERNELKTSLFLVQEELAYYQRELLNDERIPSLLLDAVKSTIKKQRRKIRAKMLGTAEEPLSSDQEEEGVWLGSPMGSDCVDSRLPESKIRSFFGLWYRGSSKSSSPEDCPGAWEIVDPQDVGPEEEEEQGGREASCSFSPPSGPSPFPRVMERWALPLFLCLQALGLGDGSSSPDLDPSGRNVCRSSSHPPVFTCCPGWKQEGQECPAALCTGADACREGEVCVRPGVCRCRPGFFGANCIARCPDQYWGPDCKESCACHPNGKCDPANGECRCHPGWWGPLCQSVCPCGPRGRCDPLTGVCHCEPGWWAPDCRRQCPCNLSGSRCDPVTGRCLCHRGWWGRRCSSLCSCHGSPCAQETGRCECRTGQWGAACQASCQCLHGTCAPQDGRCTCHAGYQGDSCREPCPAGKYGLQCMQSCGHCQDLKACFPVDGSCPACDPGWNGTHCKQPCPPGHHGENCALLCPPGCREGESCHPETGECRSCKAGLTGARCELSCPEGFFGDGCRFVCPDCFNGSCDPASGACVCQAGFWGTSCNWTCPAGSHGPNCSEPCQCGGGLCHPVTGDCQWGQNQAALLAGILTPLILLVLLCMCCCCCCCCESTPMETRSAAVEGDPISRVKHHVLGTLANLSPTLPCFSLGGYKLPRVTVSHHDAEIPFNPSFIEPPSAAWPSDSSFSSSFDTDEDHEDPASPAQEAARTKHQPGFPPEEPALNSEPFAIPRTSSIAKAKRPSVSFAEGTRFISQSPRGSTEALNPTWKAKAPWGSARATSLQQPPADPAGQEGLPAMGESPGGCYENVEPGGREEGSHRPCSSSSTQRRSSGGHRKRGKSSRHVAQRVEALEAASKAQAKSPGVTTIYVTVGKAGSEGPVQAVLQRLGSLQRAKQLPREELQQRPRRRSLEGLLQKPPRRRVLLDSEGDAGRLLPQGGTGQEAATMLCAEASTPEEAAEPQGFARGPGAPAGGESGGGSSGGSSSESPSSHSQAEVAAGGGGGGPLLEKEEQEPKYENVSGWSSSP
nr:scavenger receptor class F member 1 [Zootoca vivipara]